MSLILEALRKSEQQRRLGETPTLATDSAWATRRWHGAATRGARWPWIVLALLLVAGGAAAWWLLPRGSETPAVPAPGAEAAVSTGTGDPAPAPAPAAIPVDPQPQATIAAPPVAIDPMPAPVVAVPPASELPGGPAVRLEAPTPSPDGEYPEVPAPADRVASTEPAMPADAPATATSAQIPAAPAIAPPPVAEPTPASPPESPPAPTSAAPAMQSTGGDVLPVYALSLAIRQSLPPLKLSMHVWNADPARRFVILGDTRATEGENAADDLRIVEIRRDGVVLDFRGTQFLLPRAGY
jgi:general secretion pathway protein B